MSTRRPRSKSVTRRSERSTSIRVVTGASSTSTARTQPVLPFGFSGSCTRYHCTAQRSSTRFASTAKIVGTPLTFSGPNDASRPEPGARYACARSCTTAA